MAQRRMLSQHIMDSDAFLDMPPTTQILYVHLCMRADDDGFVGNPKKIMRMVGSVDDDLKVLLAKRFLLKFDSGVIVIKHWRIHNYIQKDRYQETKYLEEKAGLVVKNNGSYTECIQDVSSLDTQVRLGKSKVRKEDYFSFSHEDKIQTLKKLPGIEVAADYQADGWSPLDEKKAKKKMERILGLNKTNKFGSFIFKAGWDFRKGYKYFTGEEYVGEVVLDEVAKNLSLWFSKGETQENIQDMITAFFKSDKAKKTAATPTSVFSTHTYNAWKQKML